MRPTASAPSRMRIHFPGGEPLITVRRPPKQFGEVVYVLTANRLIKYAQERSHVVYVGRSDFGLPRLCASAAIRGRRAFQDERGIRSIHVWPLTWATGRDVGTAKVLERAFLLRFREFHGEIPILNKQGTGMRERDEFDFFRRIAVDRVIRQFGTTW